jgi:hypothetical protein
MNIDLYVAGTPSLARPELVSIPASDSCLMPEFRKFERGHHLYYI